MVDLSESKQEFIREISTEEDQVLLQAVVAYYHSLKINRDEMLRKFSKPIRKRLDPEMLKKQQKFRGHDYAAIKSILSKIDIPESI